MGVAKGTLGSIVRSLAVQLGPENIRINVVDAGPLRTPAARAIPGAGAEVAQWSHHAPLGWDVDDRAPVAAAIIALLSDLFSATTGASIVVDGGLHAVGR
jgi:enoyl-[acyl-carrier protein] reductase I